MMAYMHDNILIDYILKSKIYYSIHVKLCVNCRLIDNINKLNYYLIQLGSIYHLIKHICKCVNIFEKYVILDFNPIQD